MIKVITSSSSKIGLVVFVFFVTIPVEVLARPLRPDLEVVQPLHNDHGPLKMYLGWDHDSFFDVQEVQFRKKIEGGEYGPWCNCGPISIDPPVNHPCCEKASDFYLTSAYIDKSGLLPEVRYTYQVQVKINDKWSFPSIPRSNKAVTDRIWPVTNGPAINGECTGDESIGLVNGLNQIIRPTGCRPYPHEGIDLRGEKAVPSAGECVRAPVGGKLGGIRRDFVPDDYEKGFTLEFYLNGKEYYMSFNHLVPDAHLESVISVEPGEYLGTMATRADGSPLPVEQQHIHIAGSPVSVSRQQGRGKNSSCKRINETIDTRRNLTALSTNR